VTNENTNSEEVYVIGLPSLYISIPVRTEIRRRVLLAVGAIACTELKNRLKKPYGLLLTHVRTDVFGVSILTNTHN